MIEMYASPEMNIGLMNASILYVEKPFIKLKDRLFPPSVKTLNKRIGNYVDAYLNGGTTAGPIIWDAIRKGGDANLMMDTTDANGKKNGSEPAIVRAARKGEFFLVQGLHASGADITKKDSFGDDALTAGVRAGSVEITSYLIEAGAKVPFAADFKADPAVLKYIESVGAFNKAAVPAQDAPAAAAPAATAKPTAPN